ncbi:hypothetical protein ROHU_003187 [Labeo rohita]|uniref:Uncharacterized protein n=1 Tax=Labeo rohita TaxID=84645 RepID=A0A498NWM2_LABRO|nr:hypothetical protein ROHU_003187 [Labeo rohita]
MPGGMWEAVECVPSSAKAKNHLFTLHQHQPSSQEGGIYGGSGVPAVLGIESTREEPCNLPRVTQAGPGPKNLFAAVGTKISHGASYRKQRSLSRSGSERKRAGGRLENAGIDPATSRMLSERSTI